MVYEPLYHAQGIVTMGWDIGQKEKLASRASGSQYGVRNKGRGACGHSLNAAVL